jgi:hypothetical protein
MVLHQLKILFSYLIMNYVRGSRKGVKRKHSWIISKYSFEGTEENHEKFREVTL